MNILKVLPIVSAMFFTPSDKTVDDFCGMKNKAFAEGESVNMTVYYSTMGAYIGAGEATFTTALERLNGKPVYHVVGLGKRLT